MFTPSRTLRSTRSQFRHLVARRCAPSRSLSLASPARARPRCVRGVLRFPGWRPVAAFLTSPVPCPPRCSHACRRATHRFSAGDKDLHALPRRRRRAVLRDWHVGRGAADGADPVDVAHPRSHWQRADRAQRQLVALRQVPPAAVFAGRAPVGRAHPDVSARALARGGAATGEANYHIFMCLTSGCDESERSTLQLLKENEYPSITEGSGRRPASERSGVLGQHSRGVYPRWLLAARPG